MANDVLPGTIVTFTRDQVRDKYLRDYKLRNPSADVGPGSLPYVDACALADATQPIYSDAITIGNGTNLTTSRGKWLATIGHSEGVDPLPAAGASGYVQISASSGGGTIFAGDEIKDPKSGLRFNCLTTALYLDKSQVPVVGVDTGPATNLAAGLVLVWSSPRPGISPSATVVAQSDGSGLSGGRDTQNDDQYALSIAAKRANPPASGNDAEYQHTVETTSGIGVEKCFTYPAIKGPGTIGVCFTLKPATVGASRLPNTAQIGAVAANLQAREPADDGVFTCSLTGQNVAVVLKVTWASGAPGWADSATWPQCVVSDIITVVASPAPTATTFRLTTGTSTTTPQTGQTIGFYDASGGVFRRKRILSVAVVVANKSWDIVVDTTNSASDTSYTPAVGQVASPWSDSLTSLIPAVASYFATLGPGEQVASFLDPGARQRRSPQSPASWPSTLSNRLVRPVQDLATIADADLIIPAPPYATPVGTAGVLSYLLQLGDLAAFPQ